MTNIVKSEQIKSRYSLANIILFGKPGTGKRTFINAFAQKFGYEMIVLNALSLDSLEGNESYVEMESMFARTKQVAPAILYVSKLEDSVRKEVYLSKIFDELSKINKHLQIFVILAINDNGKLSETDLKSNFVGYKKFNSILNFNIPESLVLNALNTINDSKVPFDLSCLTIGQAISLIEEQRILQN